MSGTKQCRLCKKVIHNYNLRRGPRPVVVVVPSQPDDLYAHETCWNKLKIKVERETKAMTRPHAYGGWIGWDGPGTP